MDKMNSMADSIAAYAEAANTYTREPITQETYYKIPEEPKDEEIKQEVPEPTHQEPVAHAFSSQADTSKQPETNKEYNMRILRERAEQEERKRKEIEQRAAQLEEQMRQMQSQWKPQTMPSAHQSIQEDSFQEPEDDDIPTWGQQKKFLQKIQKQLEDQRADLARQAQERNMRDAEEKFIREHPDGSAVLSKENLDILKRVYPYDFAGIENNPDLYGKLKSAYNMVKRYGIIEDQEIEKRVARNIQQPRPASVANAQVSDSPLGKVDEYGRRELSEADKEQMRYRMMKARGLI